MVTGPPTFTYSFAVGEYQVTIALWHAAGRTVVGIDWTPDMPELLSNEDFATYRFNRDAVIEAFGDALNIPPEKRSLQ